MEQLDFAGCFICCPGKLHFTGAVSYTHLDVYKRQAWGILKPVCVPIILITVITTVVVMIVTGRVTQAVIRRLFGINLRCHHLSWYSMQGEGKRDYPASISYQSAWYPYYSYIEDYFARLHVLLSQGEPLCDLLIVYPVESLWCRIYPKWSWQLQTLDPEVQKLEQIYEDTFHLLCGARVDFDYGDEDYYIGWAVWRNRTAYRFCG